MKFRMLVVSVLAAFAAAACAEGGGATRPVAATIGDTEVLVADVREALERFEKTDQFQQLASQSGDDSARRQFEQAYLSQHIRRAVLAPQAEEMGIEVTRAEIDEQLEQIKANFPSEAEFEDAVTQRGFTLKELEDLVRDQLLEQKLREEVTKDSAPSEQEVRDYYSSHPDDYQQSRVQHILVEKIGLARNLSNQLQKAKDKKVASLFAKLAKKNSTDKSNKNDAGKLGWVGSGELVAEFEAAMNELGIDEVSAPVRTQFGVHVIRVTDRRKQSFQDVAQEIEDQLAGTAGEEVFQEWYADALEAADVELNSRYGELDPRTGQVVDAGAEQVPGAEEPSPSG